MANGWDFLYSVAATTGGTVMLLAIAGWLCRTQIAHWLNRDMETVKAMHQESLEHKKAELARELEAYRTNLFAQVEAMKAAQDVKKSMALLVAQRRFEAIEKLRTVYWSIGMELELFLQVWDRLGKEERSTTRSALETGLEAVRNANKNAFPFLDIESAQALIDFSNTATIALGRASHPTWSRVECGLADYHEQIFELRCKADQVISKHWRAMLAMEDIHIN